MANAGCQPPRRHAIANADAVCRIEKEKMQSEKEENKKCQLHSRLIKCVHKHQSVGSCRKPSWCPKVK
jgi:hypothetical protein